MVVTGPLETREASAMALEKVYLFRDLHGRRRPYPQALTAKTGLLMTSGWIGWRPALAPGKPYLE